MEKVDALPGPIPQPPADPEWHSEARAWYESLAASGQARYYEPSDWATARIWALALSGALMPSRYAIDQKFLSAWHSAAADLLTTEGARRRARVEVERAQTGEDAAATPPPAAKPDSKARLRSVAAS